MAPTVQSNVSQSWANARAPTSNLTIALHPKRWLGESRDQKLWYGATTAKWADGLNWKFLFVALKYSPHISRYRKRHIVPPPRHSGRGSYGVPQCPGRSASRRNHRPEP